MDQSWNKLTRRDGGVMYVGKLEEYLNSFIDSNDYKSTKDGYAVECPYCIEGYKHDLSYHGVPYTKRKLYITKDKLVGYCHRCHSTFIESNENIRYQSFDWDDPIAMQDFDLEKLDGPVWNLKTFESFDEFDEQGYDYLIHQRHRYFRELAKGLKIRYSNHNPVIPFFYHGELIFYQIKMAFGNGIPYFTPPINHKPAYIIEHGSNLNFVVCEGTFDAIANLILYPDRTPFAVLGSDITPYQIAMLRSYVPEDVLVYMDDTELSLKVADRIMKYLPYANVHIKSSDGTDPEEFLKLKLRKEAELL